MVRRVTVAVLAAALAGAVLAVPANSKSGPAVIAKKKAKKCKKGKKGKKRKGCNRGSPAGLSLPGQATPSKPKQPDPPPILHVTSVGVNPGTVLAGNPATGQVTLDVAAPSGGQQVDLQSNAASVSVPGSVVVAAGQQTANFQVTTTPTVVATATLTASIGASSGNAQLKVVDKPSVSSVQLERHCFTPASWSANQVNLDIPAPSDTVVSLSSDKPLSLAPTSPTVTVPTGSTSAPFSVDVFAVDAPLVTVSAAAPSTPAATATASVSSTDPATHVAGLTLNPDTVVAGQQSHGTVTLDCEAPGPSGTTVTLTADSGVGVANVVVPAGALSAGFTITTAGDLADGQYDVRASAGGDPPVHATLTINSSLPT